MAGYVELISVREISGWTNSTRIEIVINGEVRGMAALTGVRQDCIDAGYANARGLFFRPTRYLNPGENRVIVRDGDNLEPLHDGDQTIFYDPMQTVDTHWSSQYSGADHVVSRWWQCERIVQHVNRRICGDPLSDLLQGLRQWIVQEFSSRLPLRLGISVGCGQGTAERAMIQSEIVKSFDLFELSTYAIESGQEAAEAVGLGRNMRFHRGDAFTMCNRREYYDLVLWHQSLHHMPDVDAALAWSRAVLRRGGILVVHEYVGPTRFQFREKVLVANSRFRQSLPKKFLSNPWAPATKLSAEVTNPDLDELIAADPSEGTDSGRILECLGKHFPAAKVRLTGGIIYHLGLNDILHNLVQDGAIDEIDRALALDDEFTNSGETQYAVALAVK
jgi:SAM-dependent methyltransferase